MGAAKDASFEYVPAAGTEEDNKTERISLISIIYRVAPYLTQCIESLISQSYPDLEIILVVGEPPEDREKQALNGNGQDRAKGEAGDGCLKIAEHYAGLDSRIKIVTCIAAGAADARNRGLSAATGDFIAFVDGDDWAEPDMIESLHRSIKESGADIAVCSKFSEYKDATVPDPGDGREILSPEESYRMILLGTGFFFHCWDKLFRAELFEGLLFPTEHYIEDRYIVGELIYRARNIVYDRKPLYHFRVRSDSLSRAAGISEMNLEADELFTEKAVKRFPALKQECEAFLLYDHITCIQNKLLKHDFSKKDIEAHVRYVREHKAGMKDNPYINRNTRIKAFLSLHFLTGLKLITERGRHRQETEHEKYSI